MPKNGEWTQWETNGSRPWSVAVRGFVSMNGIGLRTTVKRIWRQFSAKKQSLPGLYDFELIHDDGQWWILAWDPADNPVTYRVTVVPNGHKRLQVNFEPFQFSTLEW